MTVVILERRKGSRWRHDKLLILKVCWRRCAGRKDNIKAGYISAMRWCARGNWRQEAREPYQCLIIAAYLVSVIVLVTAFALYDPISSSLMNPIAVRTRKTRTSQLY